MGKGLDQLVPEKKAKKCSYTANVSVYSESNVSANGVWVYCFLQGMHVWVQYTYILTPEYLDILHDFHLIYLYYENASMILVHFEK